MEEAQAKGEEVTLNKEEENYFRLVAKISSWLGQH